MKVIAVEKLDNICGGGTTITGTIISGVVDVIKVLYDAGLAFGSSIRRIIDKQLCPVD